MFSINSWTKEWPTLRNVGQWFWVRAFGKTFPKEIRCDGRGTIYLADVCYEGVEKKSYGIMLKLYGEGSIEFCGPMQMPPDYVHRTVEA
jgi:hypothetical protein